MGLKRSGEEQPYRYPASKPTLVDEDLMDKINRLPDVGWWPCCDHCGCGTPDGVWPTRDGHDDTCAQGCNDT